MAVTGSIEAVRELEVAIGAPAGTFDDLLSENDWAFVIKLHALVEGAVTHLLTLASGKPDLEKTFARLDLSDPQRGKLAFLRGYGLLEDRYRKFISMLSQVRNRFVHDVRSMGMTLPGYVEALDSNQRNAFLTAVSLESDRPIKFGKAAVALRKFTLENPKLSMWLASMDLLANVYLQKLKSETQLTYAKFATDLANAVEANALENLTIGEPPASLTP